MPETYKDLYAAAVNPPRRVKRSHIPESPSSTTTPSSSSPHRPILPMRPYAPREPTSVPALATSGEPVVPPPPAKRGRKPGPLSRTAREAQRRLNHSIIEKARRTKINDALATLKQLVPPNYGPGQMKQQQQQQQAMSEVNGDEEEEEDDDDDDDDDDDEYDDDTKRKKKLQQQKAKANAKPNAKGAGTGTGKKEEKEKEFKLEILVRTVSFLQDLLERVSVLESAPLPSLSGPTLAAPVPVPAAEANIASAPPPICPNCGAEFRRTAKGREPSIANANPKKRKHMHVDSDNQHHAARERDVEKTGSSARHAKIPRRYGYEDSVYERAADLDLNVDVDMGMGMGRDAAPIPVSVPVSRSRAFPDRPHRGSQTDASHPHPHHSSSPTDRLPPISSWLHNNSHLLNEERPRTMSPSSPSSTSTSASTPPNIDINNSMIDPQLLPPSEPIKHSRSRMHSYSNAYIHTQQQQQQQQQSYLPSPPGSTHFDPVRSSSAGVPPLLSLGPVASVTVDSTKINTKTSLVTASASTSPEIRAHAGSRTPEDESAATLLLQIASSPTFRAVGSESASLSSPVFRGISSSSSSSSPSSASSSASFSASAGVTASAIKRAGGGAGVADTTSTRDREFDHADERERDPSVFILSSSAASDVRSEGPSGTRRSRAGYDFGSAERRRNHHDDHDHERGGGNGEHPHPHEHGQQQAQTPSSLLGLKLGMGARRGY